MNKFKFSNKYNNPYSNDIEKRNNQSGVKVVNNNEYFYTPIIINTRKNVIKKEKNIQLKAVDEWVK